MLSVLEVYNVSQSILVSTTSGIDHRVKCRPGSFFWLITNTLNVRNKNQTAFKIPTPILLTQCYYHRGTRLNAMKRFCIFSY